MLKNYIKKLIMRWLLTWLNGSVATLNATLQLLVIYWWELTILLCLHFVFQNVVKWFNFLFIYLFIITCIRLCQCTQCLELVYALAGLKIDEFSRAKMEATAKELIEEASFAKSCLNEQWSHLSLENEEDLINIWI